MNLNLISVLVLSNSIWMNKRIMIRNLEIFKAFYEKGLNNVGWNNYTKINIKFENQIICTKR